MLPDPVTLTLRDYLVPVVKRRWMILALVVVITAVVSAYYARLPITYTAATQVFIGPSSDPALGVGPSEPTLEAVANEATLLTSTEQAAIVAKKIGYAGSPGSLAASVSASPSATTNTLNITADASSSAESARIANAFARQFIAQNTAAQVTADQKQIRTLTKQLQSLKGPQNTAQRQSTQSQIQQLQLSDSTVVGSASQINVAQGGVASSHSVVEFGVLAAIGALIGGILLAFLLERMDPRLKGIQHTEMIFQHPVLATVWHDDDIEHFVDGKPALSRRSREAFRNLRIGLSLVGGEHLKTIVVSSAVPDEGKSTVARNLALALAEAGRRVALVDADLRKSTLSRELGRKSGRGLADVITGKRTLAEVLVEVPIDVPKLRIGHPANEVEVPIDVPKLRIGHPANEGPARPLHDSAAHTMEAGAHHMASNGSSEAPAGFGARESLSFLSSGTKPENPQGILESEGFRAVLKTLASSFDVVVIDSTPLTLVSDAIPVLREVDAGLLVARSTTDSRSARHASEVIQRVPGVNVVGLVVNDVPEAAAAAYGKGYGYGYYGYGYGHGYGAYGYGHLSTDEAATPEPPPDSSVTST